MSGRLRYRDAITHTERRTEKIKNLIPGILGFTIKGKNVVEVDPRPGYVYVRIRDNFSEVVQAYNGVVSPVYGLPVLLIRDDKDQNKYKIYGRDTGRYAGWGTTSGYLPKHGSTHSFNPKAPGYDPTWVWGRQMMPLAATPSGSLGAPNVIIQEGVYWQNNVWNCAGATGTANIAPTYNPTGSSARMVLIYIDANTTPQLLAGSTFFASTITGTSAVLPYIPAVPNTLSIPIAGIRLVSGTSTIQWDNIYDVRPWIVGSGYIPTGTSNGHVIEDDGVAQTQRTSLNFVGAGFVLYDNNNVTNVSGTATLPAFAPYVVPFADSAGALKYNTKFVTDELTGYPSTTVGAARGFFVNSNGYDLNLVTDADQGQYNLGMWGFGYNPRQHFLYANGTNSSPTAVNDDDVLGETYFYGYNGSLWKIAGIIQGRAEKNWAASTGSASIQVFIMDESAPNNVTNPLSIYDHYVEGYRFVSSIASGTSPYACTSPTLNTNLNSDMVDGYHASDLIGINSNAVSIPIYDDNIFKVTGSAIHFDANLSVAVTGSVAFVAGSAGGSGNNTYISPFVNRPSGTVNNGDLFFPSDGISIDRVTGSSSIYQSYGPIFPLNIPPTVGWTWDNQESGTVSTSGGALNLSTPIHAAAHLHGIYRTAPSTPYKITIAVLPYVHEANYQAVGLMFRQSSDGKIVTFGLQYENGFGLRVQKWNSSTDYSGLYDTFGLYWNSILWLRIEDDGVNRICSASMDSMNWYPLHTIGRTDFLTANQVGIYIKSENGTWGCAATFISYLES